MKVRNLRGTSARKCGCKSWIKHWMAFSDAVNEPTRCGARGCSRSDILGAHVEEVGGADRSHHIAILCAACNNQFGQEIELEGWAKLAPASKAKTCSPPPSWVFGKRR